MKPLLISALFCSALLTACNGASEPPPTPPVGVGVYDIELADTTRSWALSARTQAAETVQIQARVSAEVAEVRFDRGASVEAGQLLFRLDDRVQRDQLQQAQAQMVSRQSALDLAERNLARGLEVAERGFLSAADVDRLRDGYAQARSALSAAQADLQQAEQNLEYTQITAPISGRVGDTRFTVGNVVGPTSGPLVQLQATQPMLARFQLTDREYLELMNQYREGLNMDQIEIHLLLENGYRHPSLGHIDFVDIEVEASTGTVDINARFDNPDGVLVPGLFATVELILIEPEQRLLVPNLAIRRNQLGPYVMVVQADQTVVERQITIARQLRTTSVVAAGLSEGEQVVVEGLQKLRPGGVVSIQHYDWDEATGLLAPRAVTTP